MYPEEQQNTSSLLKSTLNIEELLVKPTNYLVTIEKNPIALSFKTLLHNLTCLSYKTYDPFTEATEYSARYGTETDISSLACLSLSYYTMGQFNVNCLFFENSFQFMHELKPFYYEFECIFNDKNNLDPIG